MKFDHLVHDLLAVVVIAALALFLSAYPVKAHEAPSGFAYPAHCCHDADCGPAIRAVRNPDGSLTVTTKHGTATFPSDFKHELSPDGMIHACFTSATLYCLYLSTGI